MQSIPPRRRVYAYRRVSSPLQQQRGHSLDEDQPAVLARLAEAHGLEVAAEFEDVHTASRHSRPGFLAMLAALETDPAVEGLVVAESDRVTRASARERATLQELLESRQITVYALDGVYHLGTYDSDSLAWEIRGAVSADFLRRLRRALRESHRSRAERGVWAAARVPYGYQRVYRGRDQAQTTGIPLDLVPDPEAGPVVRAMFERYAGGTGLQGIARWLNDAGLGGRTWTQLAVRQVLLNGIYAGLIIRGPKADPIIREAVNAEPLVDVELWEQVQALLTAQHAMGSASRTAPKSLLAGLLRCSCGARIYSKSGPRSVGKRRYWCVAAREHRGDCREPSFSETRILAELLPHLREYLRELKEPEPEAEGAGEAQERTRRVIVLRKQLDALLELYLLGFDNPRQGISREVYDARRAPIEQELVDLEAAPVRRPPPPPLATEVDAYLERLDHDALRQLLVWSIREIKVAGGHLVPPVLWR